VGALSAAGYVPSFVSMCLIISAIALEIACICISDKSTKDKISKVSFYGIAAGFGGLLGLALYLVKGEDREMLQQIYVSAFIYTTTIFVVFSLFALLTCRRTVTFLTNFFISEHHIRQFDCDSRSLNYLNFRLLSDT